LGSVQIGSRILAEIFYMSEFADIFHKRANCSRIFHMKNWLENTLHQGWQVPTMVINKLRTDAERWQAAVREFKPPLNLADILRARSLV
jgi:hypothetical protein